MDKMAHEEKRKELAKRARLHALAVQAHERDEAVARGQEMARAREAAARAARAEEEEREKGWQPVVPVASCSWRVPPPHCRPPPGFKRIVRERSECGKWERETGPGMFVRCGD